MPPNEQENEKRTSWAKTRPYIKPGHYGINCLFQKKDGLKSGVKKRREKSVEKNGENRIEGMGLYKCLKT